MQATCYIIVHAFSRHTDFFYTMSSIIYYEKITKQCVLIFRLGVDAFGYEDKGVQQLRCKLVTFLCGGCTKKGLLVQIATVTALLGLLSLDFETIIQDTVKFLANSSQSFAADSIKKWFSSLSEKQQDLSLNLLQTGGVNRN